MYSHKQILPQRAYKSRIMNSIQGLGKTNCVVKSNGRYIIQNIKYHLTCTSFSICNHCLANCLQPSFITEIDQEERNTSTCFYCNWKTVLCKSVFNPGLYSEIREGFILFCFFLPNQLLDYTEHCCSEKLWVAPSSGVCPIPGGVHSQAGLSFKHT